MKRRPLLLLEVIIAFTLLVLCILPLLYPLIYLLKAQNQFIRKIELDHQVSLHYGEQIRRLYMNEISWDELNDGKIHSFNGGTYIFSEVIHKPKEEQPFMLYLKSIDYSFPDGEKYHYDIFITRGS